MRTTSVAVMVIFFRKYHSESTWSQLYWKFFLKNYETLWQLDLKQLTTEDFTDMDQHRCQLHQDIWLIIIYFSFSQASIVFRFGLMLAE